MNFFTKAGLVLDETIANGLKLVKEVKKDIIAKDDTKLTMAKKKAAGYWDKGKNIVVAAIDAAKEEYRK